MILQGGADAIDKLDYYDTFKFMKYTYKSELDKAMHTLEGIIKGIAIDGIINSRELRELRTWLKDNKVYFSKPPFDELLTIVNDALIDNILDQEEANNILWFC